MRNPKVPLENISDIQKTDIKIKDRLLFRCRVEDFYADSKADNGWLILYITVVPKIKAFLRTMPDSNYMKEWISTWNILNAFVTLYIAIVSGFAILGFDILTPHFDFLFDLLDSLIPYTWRFKFNDLLYNHLGLMILAILILPFILLMAIELAIRKIFDIIIERKLSISEVVLPEDVVKKLKELSLVYKEAGANKRSWEFYLKFFNARFTDIAMLFYPKYNRSPFNSYERFDAERYILRNYSQQREGGDKSVKIVAQTEPLKTIKLNFK